MMAEIVEPMQNCHREPNRNASRSWHRLSVCAATKIAESSKHTLNIAFRVAWRQVHPRKKLSLPSVISITRTIVATMIWLARQIRPPTRIQISTRSSFSRSTKVTYPPKEQWLQAKKHNRSLPSKGVRTFRRLTLPRSPTCKTSTRKLSKRCNRKTRCLRTN